MSLMITFGWLIFLLIAKPKDQILFGVPLLGFLLTPLLLVAQHQGIALDVVQLSYFLIFVSISFKLLSHGES